MNSVSGPNHLGNVRREYHFYPENVTEYIIQKSRVKQLTDAIGATPQYSSYSVETPTYYVINVTPVGTYPTNSLFLHFKIHKPLIMQAV